VDWLGAVAPALFVVVQSFNLLKRWIRVVVGTATARF